MFIELIEQQLILSQRLKNSVEVEVVVLRVLPAHHDLLQLVVSV